MSSSSMTPNTTPILSMKPLTATLSIRFVAALYSVRKTVHLSYAGTLTGAAAEDAGLLSRATPPASADQFDVPPFSESDGAREKLRRTSGDNSASTLRARRAEDARRCVGSGIQMMLGVIRIRIIQKIELYGLQSARKF